MSAVIGEPDALEPDARRTVFIVGPTWGYPLDNEPAFEEAAIALDQAGYRVVRPEQSLAWPAQLAVMLGTQGVAALPGSLLDRRAEVAIRLANDVGMSVRPVEAW